MKSLEMTDRFKRNIWTIIVSIGIVGCLFLTLYQHNKYSVYKKFDITGQTLHDSGEYEWNIERIDIKYDVCYISGWIVKLGEDIESRNIQLIVVNDDGSSYRIFTEMVKREDITDMYKDTDQAFDYDASGFAVLVNKKYIHSENSKIYILYQNNEHYDIVDIGLTPLG